MQKNKAQEAAISHINGPMIIIACPGSGKTTTLLRRIHHMTKTVDPNHILMVTFTRAAAKEMRTRYENQFEKETGVTFCTIHSLCYQILRQYMKNVPDIMKEHDIHEFFYQKVRKNKQINDRNDFIRDLMLDITSLKNTKKAISDFKPKCTSEKKLFVSLYQDYEKYKKTIHCMDMDDLLLLTYDLLKKQPAVLRRLQERFQYIQVDEYQDTNYVQRDILYLLTGKKRNLVVVGDDDQAIYYFRGAEPKIMLQFTTDFPEAKAIYLSTNYRSAKGLIEKSSRLIEYNAFRFQKEFQAFHQNQGHIEVQKGKDRGNELDMVMQKMKVLVQAGESLEDIAVLYRTNNQSMMLAEYCIKHGIPFKTQENVTSKYHHWLFWDLYSYHRLAEGEGLPTDIGRTLNHPNRFLFGEGFVTANLDRAKMRDYASMQDTKQLWQINKMYEEIDKYLAFLKSIKGKGPMDVIRQMNKDLNYKKYIKDYATSRNEDPSSLLELWDSYLKDARDKGDNDWEQWERSIRKYDNELKKMKNNQHGITLSTMHKAKGLEWEHVFLIDCIKGNHPYKKAEGQIELEEERRLFYVAMTRAKQFLYLYYYTSRGKNGAEPSIYLSESRCL